MSQPSLHPASGPSEVLTPWERAGFHVCAERRGAGGTVGGGDFYTLAVRAPGHIGVLIGDACGRGSDGAEQLSRILPTARELALTAASPAQLLFELNHAVAALLPADRFVTAAAFEFDMRAGILTVANAAHVPALVRRARGGHVSVIGRASGMPLGIAADTSYVDERYELRRGDVVVLMTDGVLEAIESELTLSVMSTLKQLLGATAGGANDVQRHLLRRFEACTLGRSPDDMTLMALEALSEPIVGSLLDVAVA